jgi:hypothetical protein
MTTSTQIAETIVPDLDARTAKLAAEQLALVLQVRLLDKGVKFEEAARAAIRAIPALRDVAIGITDHQTAIAVDLGPERGGQVKLYASMDAAAEDPDLMRHRHVVFLAGQIVGDLIETARGNTIDARTIN